MNLQNLLREKMKSGLLTYMSKQNLYPALIRHIESLQPTDALSLGRTGLLTARSIAVVLSSADPEFAKLWALWEMLTSPLASPRSYAIFILDKLTTLRCEGQRIIRYILSDDDHPRIGLADMQGDVTWEGSTLDVTKFTLPLKFRASLVAFAENPSNPQQVTLIYDHHIAFTHTYSIRESYPSLKVCQEESELYEAALNVRHSYTKADDLIVHIGILLDGYIRENLA